MRLPSLVPLSHFHVHKSISISYRLDHFGVWTWAFASDLIRCEHRLRMASNHSESMHHFSIQPLQQFASERGPGAAIRRPKVNARSTHRNATYSLMPTAGGGLLLLWWWAPISSRRTFLTILLPACYRNRSFTRFRHISAGRWHSRRASGEPSQNDHPSREENEYPLLRRHCHLERHDDKGCATSLFLELSLKHAQDHGITVRSNKQVDHSLPSTSTALTLASFEMNATKFQVRHLPVIKPGLQKRLTCNLREG